MLVSNEEWSELQQGIEEDKKTASEYLLHYAEKLKEYKAAKADELSKGKSEGGGHGSMPGAPTEQAAVASVAYDEKHDAYYWLKAVEVVQWAIGERKSIFLACRREAEKYNEHVKGQRPWVVMTQMLFVQAIERRFFDSGNWISDYTVRKYWHEIIAKVVDIHLRLKKF